MNEQSTSNDLRIATFTEVRFKQFIVMYNTIPYGFTVSIKSQGSHLRVPFKGPGSRILPYGPGFHFSGMSLICLCLLLKIVMLNQSMLWWLCSALTHINLLFFWKTTMFQRARVLYKNFLKSCITFGIFELQAGNTSLYFMVILMIKYVMRCAIWYLCTI